MKGIEWNEFVEDAWYGIDAFMEYNNEVYQYGGGYIKDINKFYLNVRRIRAVDATCPLDWHFRDSIYEKYEIEVDTLWEAYFNLGEDHWSAFLAQKLFDGKTLLEAGDEVEFLEWG